MTTGDPAAERAGLQARLAADPQDRKALIELGVLLLRHGEPADALASFRAAHQLDPTALDALEGIARALSLGLDPAAVAAWEAVREHAPHHAEVHLRLGIAKLHAGEPIAAQPHLQAVVAALPNRAEARWAWAAVLSDFADEDAARDQLQLAMIAEPQSVLPRFALPRLLPRHYASEADRVSWRRRLTEGFAALDHSLRLEDVAQAREVLQVLATRPLFNLAYQGEEDRAVLATAGRWTVQAMARVFPQLAERPAKPTRPDGRIRVGFASESLFGHTIARLFHRWMLGLDTTRFHVHLYRIGGTADQNTDLFARRAETFRTLTGGIDAAAAAIRADGLDVLIYPDHGMRPRTGLLAALPLAQHQAIGWGHPVTSGLSTIDSFLTSDAMEPEDGAQHYTERLVRLPRLSISYDPAVASDAARARFGLPEDRVIYFCAQSLFKYLPADDGVWPAIAREVPSALFLFLGDILGEQVTRRFQARLAAAFAAVGLDWRQHCHFLPRLGWMDYLAVNRVCDVFLDSIGWSGGNTSLEAIANGLLPITSPGRFMRGRHTTAMLRLIDLEGAIAPDRQALITLAITLGHNRDLRGDLTQAMNRNAPALWNDQGCLTALEAWIEAVAA
jgi:predicted O-linked N-acetylglucosamine transferase (SPINDLY family)